MSQCVKRLSYPRLGNYGIAIQYFVTHGAGLEYVPPPPMSKRTIDLGAKHSPDFACAPFKCMMGCYIEAMEKGATVLVQTGGTCRLGYYGELHEQILGDLGYEFEMLNLSLPRYGNILGMIRGIKKLSPEISLIRMLRAIPATVKMILSIDRVEDYRRKNMGFERERGAFDKIYNEFLDALNRADKLMDVRQAYKRAMALFSQTPTDKPTHPLRVGVVGEYFTIMDPYSNHEAEEKIARMGTEVHRWMNLTHSVIFPPNKNPFGQLISYLRYRLRRFPSSIWDDTLKAECADYTEYNVGSSGISTVAIAQRYAKAGFDGLIHVKSFGCTPEMDVIPILHNISADYKIPILFLNYDTQTSDVGIETRLEAFYDMISMAKAAREKETAIMRLYRAATHAPTNKEKT